MEVDSPRDRQLTRKQTPFVNSFTEQGCILSSNRVGIVLFVLTCLGYALLLLSSFTLVNECSSFGQLERETCLIAAMMQVGALLLEVFARQRLVEESSWIYLCALLCKGISAITNILLYAVPTPVVVDPVTGRANSMVRWSEWTMLAGVMTFMVEAIDEPSFKKPLISASSQSLSTLCGMLLPLCDPGTTWWPTTMVSFLLFFYIFHRVHQKGIALKEKKERLPASSYELRRAQLAFTMLRQCSWMWSIFVINWTVDVVLRTGFAVHTSHDYAFMVDCLVDVAMKLVYSSIIQERSDAEPILFGQERLRVVDQRMRLVWNDASDILILSQSIGRNAYVTFASPSIRWLLGEEAAALWIQGLTHERVSSDIGIMPSLVCGSVEELISRGWKQSSFTCTLCAHGEAQHRTCEVSSSTNDQGCVIVVRDITDRVKRHAAEREVLSAEIARQKDEEANSLTRHELKNGVLAAVSHCDRIRSDHQRAVYDGAIIDPSYDSRFLSMLAMMREGLEQTLDSVLSHAMAREVVHGMYVLRTEPVRIDEALSLRNTNDVQFPVKYTPADLPTVDIDPRPLRYIYRNALSNACKYGRKGGVVMTEIEFAENLITLRVINEPGEGHAALVELKNPSAVFAKGTRFHAERRPSPTARASSSGDGAWIMQKCAHALQGSCSIVFEQERTVFELTCPAFERLDQDYFESVSLSDSVWAVGVDDCEFQRFVLMHLFKSTGVPESQITVVGSERSELEGLSDLLVHKLRSLPPAAQLLAVVDENLDLPFPCRDTISGSYEVAQARRRLTPAEEARLLVYVRSANDSSKDRALYSQRAHGFLCKERGNRTRTTILCEWARRFGTHTLRGGSTQLVNTAQYAQSVPAALAELGKLEQLLDAWRDMSWTEIRRWLHRMKGIVASVKFEKQVECEHILASIDSLHAHSSMPPLFASEWQDVKLLLHRFTNMSRDAA